MTQSTVTITDAMRQQYHSSGYMLLENVIPSDDLAGLRDECQRFIDERDSEMDKAGTDTLGLNQRGLRYFVNDCSIDSPVLQQFVLGALMAEVCQATLGDDAYLFNDQYVVKGAEGGTKFGWHQDSGYVGYEHTTYLTAWCALDDVSEENGTVYLLPYDRAGTRDVVPHRKDEATNDMVGYFGSDPGIPVIVPAGSIACFSSTLFHRSGANMTDKLRRAYVVQYSAQPILSEDGSEIRHQAVPLLRGGEIVS